MHCPAASTHVILCQSGLSGNIAARSFVRCGCDLGLTGTPAKITAASLTAAGSALSGFLATTFMKAYAMASRQMSYYYGQPLVHCYLLHAEWLASIANKHVAERADLDLWNEVIKASIQASVNAQKHLLSLQEAGFTESRHRNGTPHSANASRKNGHRL